MNLGLIKSLSEHSGLILRGYLENLHLAFFHASLSGALFTPVVKYRIGEGPLLKFLSSCGHINDLCGLPLEEF